MLRVKTMATPRTSLSDSWPYFLKQNEGVLTDSEKELASMLVNLGQGHVFAGWQPPGTNDHMKHEFFSQVEKLHRSYPSPGGLRDYIGNARDLLRKAKRGENTLEGWVPEIPSGVTLEPMTGIYKNYEEIGMTEIGSVGFILVAGGLGERLGYGGAKLELPSETTTNTCFLELYIQSILAIQEKHAPAGQKLFLAIMVSDDTFLKTIALLESNSFFGMDSDQVTIMKQEKVAALTDSEAHIAMSGPYKIDSKPHGHGDVHSLMYSTGTAWKWLSAGVKYCFFFQDTNGLAFYTLPAMLGVTVSMDLEVNSMAIPRFAKQAVGAITKLVHTDGREMTVNVEYNQLDPLLRATVSSHGDINIPSTGHSPFPGNINQLIFSLAPYVKILNETHGIMAEFVNPKFTDSTNQTFKKPTRLECMMQDYPKVLSSSANVGFTSAPAWICFSPCKNNAEDAAKSIDSGVPAGSAYIAESDQYQVTAELLRRLGAQVYNSNPMKILGIDAIPGPQIVFRPNFAVFPSEIEQRFPAAKQVTISSRSTLVIEGDVIVESLWLDGYLKVVAAKGTIIIVRAPRQKFGGVVNKGQEIDLLTDTVEADISEVDSMRGYIYRVVEEEVISTDYLASSYATSSNRQSNSNSNNSGSGSGSGSDRTSSETKSQGHPEQSALRVFVFNGKNLYPAGPNDLKPQTQSNDRGFCTFLGFC